MTPTKATLDEIGRRDRRWRFGHGRCTDAGIDRTYLLAKLQNVQEWLFAGTHYTVTGVVCLKHQ